MNQRTALVSAVIVSTFLLVMIVGIATRLTQTASTIVAPTAATLPAADTNTDSTAPAIQSEREVAYQEALRQANQRLTEANAQITEANQRSAQDKARIQQANAQIQQANTQIQQARQAIAKSNAPITLNTPAQPEAPIVAAPQAPAQPAAIVPTYPVSIEQATAIAQAAANGNTMTRGPELVSYEGQVAYEVLFSPGAIYVDAQSGQILLNETIPPPPSSVAQGSHEREHEQENGEDD